MVHVNHQQLCVLPNKLVLLERVSALRIGCVILQLSALLLQLLNVLQLHLSLVLTVLARSLSNNVVSLVVDLHLPHVVVLYASMDLANPVFKLAWHCRVL
jgi:hypothetical protein